MVYNFILFYFCLKIPRFCEITALENSAVQRFNYLQKHYIYFICLLVTIVTFLPHFIRSRFYVGYYETSYRTSSVFVFFFTLFFFSENFFLVVCVGIKWHIVIQNVRQTLVFFLFFLFALVSVFILSYIFMPVLLSFFYFIV